MTLTLEMALVITKGVERYRTSLALEWLLANLFVEMTTRFEMLLEVAFGRKMNVADLTLTTAGVSLLGDPRALFLFLPLVDDALDSN